LRRCAEFQALYDSEWLDSRKYAVKVLPVAAAGHDFR
jgi:hypothetical protein